MPLTIRDSWSPPLLLVIIKLLIPSKQHSTTRTTECTIAHINKHRLLNLTRLSHGYLVVCVVTQPLQLIYDHRHITNLTPCSDICYERYE
jgi:hypothetical protein